MSQRGSPNFPVAGRDAEEHLQADDVVGFLGVQADDHGVAAHRIVGFGHVERVRLLGLVHGGAKADHGLPPQKATRRQRTCHEPEHSPPTDFSPFPVEPGYSAQADRAEAVPAVLPV